MKKLQKKAPAFKGEITAFLALIFILMVSVVGALLESASIQIAKSRMRADTMLALESTFAEYHTELLKEYEVFARFGSGEELVKSRLSYYGATDMVHQVMRLELLSDSFGAPFYRQAVGYVKDWLGMDDISIGKEYYFSLDSSPDEEEEKVLQELDSLLEQEEAELPKDNNPIESVQDLKKSSLLSLLVPDPETLSSRSLEGESLLSARELQQGNMGEQEEGSASDKLFFIVYVEEHFSNFLENDDSRALLYEQEYLLGGKASDKENLEAVCKQILQIRTVANYAYLLTDSIKQNEAAALAATMCSLLAVPAITELVKHGILLAWAYGEGIVDVRALLKQKKVPLIKTNEAWQLQLTNLVNLGTSEEVVTEKESSGGLGYADYLKGLFLLESRENLSMRSLDLIEHNLHIKTDQCMTGIEIKSEAKLQRGIQETFYSAYGYQ